MDIGTRIKQIRVYRGMTQKELGIKLGFPENSADVRIAQYEQGARFPKSEMVTLIAKVLNVSPNALTVPTLKSCENVFHALFALEDECGLRASILENRLCLALDNTDDIDASPPNIAFINFLLAWQQKALALKNKQITQQEYDLWRYNFSVSERK